MEECHYAILGAGKQGIEIAIKLAKTGQSIFLISEHDLDDTRWATEELQREIIINEARYFKEILNRVKSYKSSLQGLVKYRQDLSKTIKHKTKVYNQERIAQLTKFKNITVIEGRATFVSSLLLEVNSHEKRHLINCKKIIIATGKSDNQENPNSQYSKSTKNQIITSKDIYSLKYVPNCLLIPQINPSTIEIAYIYASLGIKVLMYDSRNQKKALQEFDKSAVNYILRDLLTHHVEFFFGLKNPLISFKKNLITIKIDEETSFEASNMYVPPQWRFDGTPLGIDQLDVVYSDDGIEVNSTGRIPKEKSIWVFGRAQASYEYNTNDSQIYDFVKNELLSFTHNNTVRDNLLKEFKSAYLSPNLELKKIYVADQVIQIGQTEQSAASKFGPSVKSVSIKKPEWEGIIKFVYSETNHTVYGAVLTGDFARSLEMNAIQLIEHKLNIHKFIHLFILTNPSSEVTYI